MGKYFSKIEMSEVNPNSENVVQFNPEDEVIYICIEGVWTPVYYNRAQVDAKDNAVKKQDNDHHVEVMELVEGLNTRISTLESTIESLLSRVTALESA